MSEYELMKMPLIDEPDLEFKGKLLDQVNFRNEYFYQETRSGMLGIAVFVTKSEKYILHYNLDTGNENTSRKRAVVFENRFQLMEWLGYYNYAKELYDKLGWKHVKYIE